MAQNWQVGLVLNNLKMGDFQSELNAAASLGVDVVQPHYEHGAMNLLRRDTAARKAVAEQIREKGLGISSVCILPEGDDYKTADNMRSALSAWLEVARDLGTAIILSRFIGIARPGVVTLLGPMTPPPFDVVEAIKPVVDRAASMGIAFAHETGLEPPEDVAAFIDQLDSPGIGVNYDPANLCAFGYDWLGGVAIIAKRIVHVHAKDARRLPNKRFEEMPLGEGEVNYDRFLQTLKKTGFQGALVIERESPKDVMQEMKRAVAFLRGKIERIQS